MVPSLAQAVPVAVPSKRCRRDRGAFTMIELLVVVGIVGILVGLLLPGLAYARFRSRVTSCANNFRQWGIAVNLYANEDPKGRLPAYTMKVTDFAGYGDLLPWMVSRATATNLGRFGVTVPLWFCPARPGDLQRVKDNMAAIRPGWTLGSLEDLTEYWAWEVGKDRKGNPRSFAVIEYNWFIPRPLEGTSARYPDPAVVRCRIPDGWPSRLEDPSGSVQPILTDAIGGGWNEAKTEVGSFFHGHEFPWLFPRDINALFVDGHVETRAKKQLRWQIAVAGSRDLVIPY